MLPEALSRLSLFGKSFGWRKKFAFLWSGSAISQLGTSTTAVASPLLALALSESALFAGWVAAAGTLPGVLLQLPAGALVDRIRRRRMLMALSQMIRLCSTLMFSLSLFYSDVPHVFLLVTVTVNGVCTTVYSLAEFTSVRRMVPEHELNSAAAKDEARGHISQVAGRFLGGFIFGIKQAWPYIFEACAAFITLVTLFVMGTIEHADPHPRQPRRPKKFSCRRTWDVWRETWQKIWKDVYLRQVILVCAAANFLLQAVILLLLVQVRAAGYSSAEIGFLLASSGFFGVLGSIVTLKKWLPFEGERTRKTTTVGFLVWIALMLLVHFSPSPALGLVFWGMFSAVGAYINIALRCHQTTQVAEEHLGRVVSLGKFITGGATALGALAAGYSVDLMEPRQILTIAAAAMFLVVVLVKWRSLQEKRRSATAAMRNAAWMKKLGFLRTPPISETRQSRGPQPQEISGQAPEVRRRKKSPANPLH